MIPYLLKAVRAFLPFENLICRRFQLASVRSWRNQRLGISFMFLVPTCLWDIWPIAEVLIPISHSVRIQFLAMISVWVSCLMFGRIIHPQSVVEMLIASSLVLLSFSLSQCILKRKAPLHYLLVGCRAIDVCLSSTPFMPETRRICSKILWLVTLKRMQLVWKALRLGRFWFDKWAGLRLSGLHFWWLWSAPRGELLASLLPGFPRVFWLSHSWHAGWGV